MSLEGIRFFLALKCKKRRICQCGLYEGWFDHMAIYPRFIIFPRVYPVLLYNSGKNVYKMAFVFVNLEIT